VNLSNKQKCGLLYQNQQTKGALLTEEERLQLQEEIDTITLDEVYELLNDDGSFYTKIEYFK